MTFNNGGSGDASGTAYNGSVARTISYNTIGAPSTTGTNASGTWSISISGSAAQLGGYNANNYAALTKMNNFSVGGTTSNWYPVIFSGDYWGYGPLELDLLRTSVHQDGSSYGYLYAKIRGHSTSWGHHRDWWEIDNIISNGTYGGFVNGMQGNPCSSDFVVWLRGGLSYYWRSDAPFESITSNAAAAYTFAPCGNVMSVKSSLDGNMGADSRWISSNFHPIQDASWSLGTTSYRWNTVYASSTIATNGSVGVGTLTPSTKLHVSGENAAIRLTGGTYTAAELQDGGSGDPGYLKLYYNGTEYFSIGPNATYFNYGSVGIGTASPQATLQVVGNIRWSSGNNSYYSYSDMDGGGLYIETVDNNTSRAKIRLQTRVNNSGSYTAYYVDANTPRHYWEISGAAAMLLSSTGTLTVSGDMVAYGSPSDRSLKTNIKPLQNSLDRVLKLKGVSFDWKEEATGILEIKEDVGFIAQEVQEVIPELVRKNENGLLSLRDKGITALLVEAVKEQQKQIEDLKKEIEELKK